MNEQRSKEETLRLVMTMIGGGLVCGIFMGVMYVALLPWRTPAAAPAAQTRPADGVVRTPPPPPPTSPVPTPIEPAPAEADPLRPPGLEPSTPTAEVPPAAAPTVTAPVLPSTPAGTVICIDPGHPSETSDGTTAADGTSENHINWVVAQKLQTTLEQAGCKVVMTKQSEHQMVTNRQRAEIANQNGAAAMLRLHCDDGGGASGWALYYPDRAATKNGVTGPPPEVCTASGEVAQAVAAALGQAFGGTLKSNGVKTDRQTYVGSKQGALTGSIYSLVPVVTVEMVFLSSPKDAAWIRQDENQWAMARALAKGALSWVQQSQR